MKSITGYNTQIFIDHAPIGEVKTASEYELPRFGFVGGSIEFTVSRRFGRQLRMWQKSMIGYYVKTKSKQPRRVFVRKLQQEKQR